MHGFQHPAHICIHFVNYHFRRIFYAKKQISRSYFYDHDGSCHGLCDDLLQHRPCDRRADKRDFCRRIPRTALYGAARISARFFLVSKIAFKKAYRIVNVKADNPFHLVLAISAVSVVCMCPLMNLAATLLFKHAGSEFLAVWIQTTALNFPMAFFWQFFFAGPLVRFLFGLFFRFS